MRAQAVTEHGADLETVDLPDPVPTGAEIVVDVARCGVCHSDVHFWEGWLDFGGQKMPVSEMGFPSPLTLGHEIYGTVAALGPDARGVAVGEPYIVYPWIGCGTCDMCAAGRDDLCEEQAALGVKTRGGFGEKVVVRDPKFLVPADDIDPSVAATLACSGLTAYAAIQKAKPASPDAPMVVIGAGGVGLNAVALLTAMDHRNIVVVDIDDAKLAVAQETGAHAVINTKGADDPVAAIAAAAGGPVRSILDFVGSGETATMGFNALAKGGKLVLVGLFGGLFAVPSAQFAVRATSVEGSYVGSLAELRDLVMLVQAGRYTPPPVETVATSEASNVLRGLRDGTVIGRKVLATA
ncbi:MAG: alcohol dehydrogenase [Pacificimonas sp.]